jgi:hypothetical protein
LLIKSTLIAKKHWKEAMNNKVCLAFIVTPLVLAGCSKAPDCSNPDSLSVVNQIVVDAAKRAAASMGQNESLLAHTKFDLTVIRTTAHDETTGKFSCEATLSSALTSEEKKVFSTNSDAGQMLVRVIRGIDFDGATMSGPIAYTVQQTDDKKSVYAEVDNSMADLVSSRVMAANIANSRTNQAAVAAQAATSKQVTITGTIEAGTSVVSIFDESGNGYSAPADTDMAKKIFASCQVGDICTIVGTAADDQFDSVILVSKSADTK